MMLRKFASPAWAMLEYGSYPLLLFIATPWFLHRLGTEPYGHWMLLTAVVGFGGVLNTGTGTATIKAVSAGIGRAESGAAERTVGASVAIALIGGSALALLVFCVFWFTGDKLLGRMGDPALIRLTGLAAAVLIWLEQLDNVFSSAMKGAEHFGHAARIEIASKTMQVLAAALVMLLAPALSALYATLMVIAVLRLLGKAIMATRLLGMAGFRPSLAGAAEIMHFAKWGWMQGVGGVLFGVADRMLVGSLLGATSLAYYSIASQLAMQIHAVAAAGLSVIFPKVSRRLEAGGEFSLWRVTKLTMAGNLLFSSLLSMTLILLGPAILRLWLGAYSAVPTAHVLPWLVLAYWVLALNVVPYYILLAMGRIRFVGMTVLASGIAGSVAMYMAVSDLGLIGAPVGRGIYALSSLALGIPLAVHFMRERSARINAQTIRPASDSGILP